MITFHAVSWILRKMISTHAPTTPISHMCGVYVWTPQLFMMTPYICEWGVVGGCVCNIARLLVMGALVSGFVHFSEQLFLW